jgi:hypothetical protein
MPWASYHMTDAHLIVISGLCLAGLSFLIYVIEIVAALCTKPLTGSKALAKQAGLRAGLVGDSIAKPTLPELTALIEGLAKLTDSLSKAGPALTSIAASILFLLIAAISAGVFQSAPKDNKGNQTQEAQVSGKKSAVSDNTQTSHSAPTAGSPTQLDRNKSKIP